MEVIRIDVKGEPVAKGRPRGGKNGYYTPQKTKAYEDLVKQAYERDAGNIKFQKPAAVGVVIGVYCPIPKSDSKALKGLKAANKIYNTKKGDVDNYAKTVLDALVGVAYDDDSQVALLLVAKGYSLEPHVVVKIFEMPDRSNC